MYLSAMLVCAMFSGEVTNACKYGDNDVVVGLGARC